MQPVRGCSIASFEKSGAILQSRGKKKKAGTEREKERRSERGREGMRHARAVKMQE
jgi:hypothetical protein